jgi:hypothetical protein
MSTSPIRYRHFTLFWKLHADSLLGAGGGDDFFAFFLPEKKYDFNKYKGFLIFLL